MKTQLWDEVSATWLFSFVSFLFDRLFCLQIGGRIGFRMGSVFLIFLSQYVLINSLEEAAMGHDRYFGD